MGKIQNVAKPKVFIEGRDLRENEKPDTDKDVVFTKGRQPREFGDEVIEDRNYRSGLGETDGVVSIGVSPGDNLGEFYVNIQYEGANGKSDLCMSGQNKLLQNASEWLRDVLDKFGADFEVAITAQPCPKAKDKIEVAQARSILTGIVEAKLTTPIQNDTKRSTEHTHKNVSKHGVSR